MGQPEVAAAFAALGLDSDADEGRVRSTFRALIISAHPDIGGDSTHDETVALLDAYRIALAHASELHGPIGPNGPGVASSDQLPHGPGGHVWLVDTDTIALACTREEAFARLVDVGHLIGSITYLDREGDLLEVLLKTRLGDTLSLVVSLQGRAEHMEAFLTCEVLDVARHELPTIEQLTELYAHHLAARW